MAVMGISGEIEMPVEIENSQAFIYAELMKMSFNNEKSNINQTY